MPFSIFDLTFSDNCAVDPLLPALPEDPNCIVPPKASEVSDLFFTPIAGTNPFDWTVSPVEAVADTIDNTNDDNTLSRHLVGKGSIADHTASTYAGPKFRNYVTKRAEVLEFLVPVNDGNYEFLRYLQDQRVQDIFYFQYATFGGKLFGGEDGILFNSLDVFFPLASGADAYEEARIVIGWEYQEGRQQRSDNPLTTTGVGGV